MGKYGMALIGNDNLSLYEIVVYKDKQNVFIRIKLVPNFNIIVPDDVHVTLRDGNNQLWTFKFESKDDLTGFIHELQKRKCKISRQNKLTSKEILSSANEDTINSNNINNSKDRTTNSSKKIEARGSNTIRLEQGNVNSGGESAEADSKSKADILSRIVKMGQKTLPTLQDHSIDAESSTSEVSGTEEVMANVAKDIIPQSNLYSDNIAKRQAPETTKMNNQISPITSTFYPNEFLSSQYVHMFSTEQRTQNAEIRMHLTQLSGKLDSILLASNRLKSSEQDDLQDRIQKLEARLVAFESATNVKDTTEENTTKNINEHLKQLENQMETLIASNSNLQQCMDHLQKESHKKSNLDFAKIEDVIKDFMNGMYVNICVNFDKESSYTGEELRKEIGRNIKSETLKLVAKLETVCLNDDV